MMTAGSMLSKRAVLRITAVLFFLGQFSSHIFRIPKYSNCSSLLKSFDHETFCISSTDEPESHDSIPTHPYVDTDALRRAWESEKLALLDAIQALKELLTQTATDAAVSNVLMLLMMY